MYKFENVSFNQDKTLNSLKLRTEKWLVRLRSHKGHIHVSVRGPNGYRKRGLSNVKADLLNTFEAKATALHFYRKARTHARHKAYGDYKEPNWIDYTNYADIFGSCFD